MVERSTAPRMIGESASFLEMQEHISHVAPLNKPVLIVGERGTGKELVGARLHFLSQRWEQSFLKINCAAMSETLLEAQLFGHEAGAFTGATKLRKGYFERANGGTLFLDELANTAMAVQEKILRVIEYGEFERLGGNETLSVDVRILAATNEDLPGLAKQHKFREDLLDRLAFDVITLPPLRERAEDILILAEHFAVGMVKEIGGEFFAGFSDKVEKSLKNYSWPGNIRELKNVIERAVYQNGEGHITQLVFNPFESPYRPKASDSAVLQADDNAPHSIDRSVPDISNMESFDLKNEVQEFEIKLLQQTMELTQFNQKKAAEFLGLSYHQLRGYLRKYDLLG
ncbi:MAG: phage shock protein operon transcriptional activator [Gammaproteobacteria bacterium]|nr:phage shock protein operon transcriptional activator [Gammaproteobacteria bacterium]MBT3859151.1 phage shock protein operon transcriptional activator [Gammaproteobacteria bacterium]MBT3987151.1 phage shock protein operon transcriptional activator [Gammaproteobacteria bacterium]MBT4255108.1 phage shock protein operon transcriptional activator [Gammaproteobacteria bacterium]MBT4580570.1 phage shock protein operon transcriptional activator [Gammaproteobacteria bacterium]